MRLKTRTADACGMHMGCTCRQECMRHSTRSKYKPFNAGMQRPMAYKGRPPTRWEGIKYNHPYLLSERWVFAVYAAAVSYSQQNKEQKTRARSLCCV
jgi:hypothetical protein